MNKDQNLDYSKIWVLSYSFVQNALHLDTLDEYIKNHWEPFARNQFSDSGILCLSTCRKDVEDFADEAKKTIQAFRDQLDSGDDAATKSELLRKQIAYLSYPSGALKIPDFPQAKSPQ